MAGEKLTKRVVDALKAPEPSKVGVKVREHFLWDRELRGFGVQVMPSGLKSFVIQYRNPEGRPRRVVIGRYGQMTVEEARTSPTRSSSPCPRHRPSRQEAKSAGRLTVAEICDWYLAEAEAGRSLAGSAPYQGFHTGDGSKPDEATSASPRSAADRFTQARRHRGRAGRHRRR